MIQLKDILKKDEPISVEWRILFEDTDTLAGYTYWDGEKFLNVDGDSYSLEEEVVGCFITDKGLVYWTKGE